MSSAAFCHAGLPNYPYYPHLETRADGQTSVHPCLFLIHSEDVVSAAQDPAAGKGSHILGVSIQFLEDFGEKFGIN